MNPFQQWEKGFYSISGKQEYPKVTQGDLWYVTPQLFKRKRELRLTYFEVICCLLSLNLSMVNLGSVQIVPRHGWLESSPKSDDPCRLGLISLALVFKVMMCLGLPQVGIMCVDGNIFRALVIHILSSLELLQVENHLEVLARRMFIILDPKRRMMCLVNRVGKL